MLGFEGRTCFQVGEVLLLRSLVLGEVGSAKGFTGMVPVPRASSCASTQVSVDLENGLWKKIGFGGASSDVDWTGLGGDCPEGVAWKEKTE